VISHTTELENGFFQDRGTDLLPEDKAGIGTHLVTDADLKLWPLAEIGRGRRRNTSSTKLFTDGKKVNKMPATFIFFALSHSFKEVHQLFIWNIERLFNYKQEMNYFQIFRPNTDSGLRQLLSAMPAAHHKRVGDEYSSPTVSLRGRRRTARRQKSFWFWRAAAHHDCDTKICRHHKTRRHKMCSQLKRAHSHINSPTKETVHGKNYVTSPLHID
jgi:hypothetical protein